jgi:hypothetical protein
MFLLESGNHTFHRPRQACSEYRETTAPHEVFGPCRVVLPVAVTWKFATHGYGCTSLSSRFVKSRNMVWPGPDNGSTKHLGRKLTVEHFQVWKEPQSRSAVEPRWLPCGPIAAQSKICTPECFQGLTCAFVNVSGVSGVLGCSNSHYRSRKVPPCLSSDCRNSSGSLALNCEQDSQSIHGCRWKGPNFGTRNKRRYPAHPSPLPFHAHCIFSRPWIGAFLRYCYLTRRLIQAASRSPSPRF